MAFLSCDSCVRPAPSDAIDRPHLAHHRMYPYRRSSDRLDGAGAGTKAQDMEQHGGRAPPPAYYCAALREPAYSMHPCINTSIPASFCNMPMMIFLHPFGRSIPTNFSLIFFMNHVADRILRKTSVFNRKSSGPNVRIGALFRRFPPVFPARDWPMILALVLLPLFRVPRDAFPRINASSGGPLTCATVISMRR
jgi:hypothetical protein